MKDQRLEELLDRWEQSREQGVELTPDELCPDDPDLRRSLAAKIDQLRQLDTMLEERPESAVVVTTPKSIGKYTVIDRIAGGGMGVVYRCRQEKPSREVAVKLIHPLRISDNALKRFRLEAEVLGMFQHPGIATIHEAGLARIRDEELPFIAMELIKGSPLDTYVTKHRPSTREIVSLLVRICGAVARVLAASVPDFLSGV